MAFMVDEPHEYLGCLTSQDDGLAGIQNLKTQSPLIHSVSSLRHQYTCLPSAYILVEIVRPLLLSTCVLANGMST